MRPGSRTTLALASLLLALLVALLAAALLAPAPEPVEVRTGIVHRMAATLHGTLAQLGWTEPHPPTPAPCYTVERRVLLACVVAFLGLLMALFAGQRQFNKRS